MWSHVFPRRDTTFGAMLYPLCTFLKFNLRKWSLPLNPFDLALFSVDTQSAMAT